MRPDLTELLRSLRRFRGDPAEEEDSIVEEPKPPVSKDPLNPPGPGVLWPHKLG